MTKEAVRISSFRLLYSQLSALLQPRMAKNRAMILAGRVHMREAASKAQAMHESRNRIA